MKVNCTYCNNILERPPCRIKNYNQFCNRLCKGKWHTINLSGKNHYNYKPGSSRGTEFICIYCGKKDIRRCYNQKLCDSSCQLKYEYANGIRDKNKITKKANEHVKKYGQPKLKGKPTWCKGKNKVNGLYPDHMGFQKKEKNPSWKGGITIHRRPPGFDNKKKEYINKKYNYTCQDCNKHQDKLKHKLEIHHIDHDRFNNKEENLIPLCKVCHANEGWEYRKKT